MELSENSSFATYLDSEFAEKYGDFFLPLRGVNKEELRKLTVGEALTRLSVALRFVPDAIKGMNDCLRRMGEEGFAMTTSTDPAVRYLSYPVENEKGKVLIIPGGGYLIVAGYVEGYPVAKELNEAGYSAYVIGYSVAEKAAFPRPLLDVASAIHSIVGEDRRYALVGFSAGGHLAASCCLKQNQELMKLKYRPAAVGLGYPVITCLSATHGNGRLRALGGQADSREAQAKLSVERHIDDKYPPTYCWCGLYDGCVPSMNSHALELALAEKSVKRKFFYMDFEDHGLGRGANSPVEGWVKDFASFLDEAFADLD